MQSASNTRKAPGMVKDKQRRINIKSKRRRNFLKKAIELKSMCGLEMLVVIKDTEQNRVHVYNMIQAQTQADCKLLSAIASMNSQSQPVTKVEHFKMLYYDDSCYDRLRVDKEPLDNKIYDSEPQI